MVNPVLSVLFDLFLVGSAITIVAAMVQEYFDSRTPSVGGRKSEERATRPAIGTAPYHAPARRTNRKAA